MEKLLCPSMMCANYGNLEKEVQDLIDAGVDIFHIDIMDGQFVPNFGMGLQDVEDVYKRQLKQHSIFGNKSYFRQSRWRCRNGLSNI